MWFQTRSEEGENMKECWKCQEVMRKYNLPLIDFPCDMSCEERQKVRRNQHDSRMVL
jgi:hypothetical protein